jgi:hypothetical protein
MHMRIKHALFLFVLLILAVQSEAAFEELEIGIASQAMGGTGVVLFGSEMALFNPASVAETGNRTVTLSGRLPFSNMDFGTFGIDGAFHLSGRWNAGLNLRYFGGDLYNEQMLAVTLAGMLTDDMSFGLQPVVCRASIADGVTEYGDAVAMAVNFGFQVRMYNRWLIAAAVRNPFQARLGNSSEYLRRRIDVGLRYQPATGMISALTFSRDFNGMRIHVGQSLPLGPVSILAGVQSNPVSISGGFDTSVGNVALKYAVITHPQLDLTHQFGVTYDF